MKNENPKIRIWRSLGILGLEIYLIFAIKLWKYLSNLAHTDLATDTRIKK
ncbi:MAG: hypothetical protein F6K40_37830 [Okeania sp. SIO3I5]|nr:hypothetical protein [Okeania sp. SIO3I5]NEQ41647.1 hypothetical protein [Okeania sp. SIO3I5]